MIGDLHAMGRRCVMIDGDTGDSASIDELAQVAIRELGGIDIWINNAAGLLVRPFLELTDADWHGLLAANLHGYFYGCRAAARQMVEQGSGGRIINVSSAADVQPLAEAVPYITAKGGIVAMTRSLALDLAPHAITVNAIAPGATDTAINARRTPPRCGRCTPSASRSGISPSRRRSPTRRCSSRPMRLATSRGSSCSWTAA